MNIHIYTYILHSSHGGQACQWDPTLSMCLIVTHAIDSITGPPCRLAALEAKGRLAHQDLICTSGGPREASHDSFLV